MGAVRRSRTLCRRNGSTTGRSSSTSCPNSRRMRRGPGRLMKRTTWTPPMHRFRGTILRTGLVVLFLTAASRAQVPAIDDPVRFDNDALGEDWSRIGAYQVVRRLASTHFVPSLIDRGSEEHTSELQSRL